MSQPVCVIAGVGPGNGAAFARRFAAAGYQLVLLARKLDFAQSLARELPAALALRCDLDDAGSVGAAFERIRSLDGPLDTLIYNASDRFFGGLDQTGPEQLEQAWRTTVLGCLMCVKQAADPMRERGRGNLIVIGATAAWKGTAGFLGFCSAKAGQRNLAQSLAKELGPAGIHVAYVVIDAIIDSQRARQRLPGKPDEFFARAEDIADAVFFLSQQPRSAWTFELDLRPFGESW